MHEDVRAASLRLDEAVTLLELNHFTVPIGMLGISSKAVIKRKAADRGIALLTRRLGDHVPAVLSAVEPARRDIVRLWSLPFKQLPGYRARWLSGAYGESVVQRRERVGTCETESGGNSGVRRDRGNIALLMGHS